MSNLSCREMARATGDYVANAVPPEARSAMEAHLTACAPCREAVALWSGIGATMREIAPAPLPPLVERRYAIRALCAPLPAASRSPRRVLWPAAACAAACAVAALALFALGPADEPTIEVAAATALAGGQPRTPEDLAEILPDGRTLVHLDPMTDVWLDPGTYAAFERIEADDVRVALHEGRIVADVGPHAFPYRFVVATPSGEVEAKGTVFTVEVVRPAREVARVLRGVIEVRSGQNRLFDPFLVFEGQQGIIGETGPSPIPREDLQRDLALLLGQDTMEMASWLAAIDSGCGNVGARERTDRAERAARSSASSGAGVMSPSALGAQDAFQDAAPSSAPAPRAVSGGRHAAALVEQALAQRQAGNFTAAAATYRQLILEHDGTLESLTALVSLGQLELYNHGRATAASAHFESYVGRAPNGALAEEARLGLVRAYDRSNRVSDVERAATEYLALHPTGYAAAEVCRARAEARRLTGNCEGARADYVRIQTEWPSSREAATIDALEGACVP
jgi:ferric-dicitrate binding protein FerR (iron transport regulator)